MLSGAIERSPLLKGLVDFVFPPLCLGCGAFNERDSVICDDCLKAIDAYNQPICLGCFEMLVGTRGCPICGDKSVPLFACANYASPVQDIIIQFKFRGITTPARFFAALLCEHYEKQLLAFKATMLIPVPLYPSREKHRGYNQATLFADQVGRRLNLPVREDILFRIKNRKPQASLTFARRMTNMKGVFAVAEPPETDTRVLLVDDVVTSGATATEASEELGRAGYEVCAVAAIAHGR